MFQAIKKLISKQFHYYDQYGHAYDQAWDIKFKILEELQL